MLLYRQEIQLSYTQTILMFPHPFGINDLLPLRFSFNTIIYKSNNELFFTKIFRIPKQPLTIKFVIQQNIIMKLI